MKKLFMMLLVIVLVFSLAGCVAPAPADNGDTAPTTTGAPVTTTSPKQSEADELHRQQAVALKQKLEAYLQNTYGEEYPENYAGAYIDLGVLYVAVADFVTADSTAEYAAVFQNETKPPVQYVPAKHTLKELEAACATLQTCFGEQTLDGVKAEVDVRENRVSVTISAPDEGDAKRQAVETFAADKGLQEKIRILYLALV